MNKKKETVVSGKADTGELTLVVGAIGLSAYVWDLSFNLGAFGGIFLGHIIAIWLFSLSVLLVISIVQKQSLPGNKWLGYFLLPLPSIWLIFRIIDDPIKFGQLTDYLLHIASILSIVISLPYLVYLFFYFTNPSILKLKGKLVAGLVGFVLLIGGVGYTLGHHNYLIMSCENFVVSGQDTPKNCLCEKKLAEKVTEKRGSEKVN
ncbi:MAG: hypothetical protein HRT69_11020 [Flavobacteriaceae bacterium]|nr:hypothetical protein [Flavobacteriaceae bacterium]